MLISSLPQSKTKFIFPSTIKSNLTRHDNESSTRLLRQRAANRILMTWLLILGVFTLLVFSLNLQNEGTTFSLVTGTIITCLCLYLNHKGYIQLAVAISSATYWIAIAVGVYTGGGLDTSTWTIFIPLILMVSLFINARTGLLASIVTVFFIIFIAWGMNRGGIVPLDFELNLLQKFVTAIAPLSLLGGELFFIAQSNEQAYVTLRKERELADRFANELNLLNADLVKSESSLQSALRDAEKTNILRLEMIKTISHEFRTPLTIINTSSQILRFHSSRLTTEQRENHQMRIERSINELDEMLVDMIRLNEIRGEEIAHGNAMIAFGELSKLMVAEIKHEAGDQADRIKFMIDGNSEKPVDINSESLVQAIAPLLENALNYSTGLIQVLIKLDTTFSIQVMDSGIGILADEMPFIFDLFYRGSRGSFLSGIGAGLNTTRNLVETMDGRIKAASDGLNSGSIFTMVFPLNCNRGLSNRP